MQAQKSTLPVPQSGALCPTPGDELPCFLRSRMMCVALPTGPTGDRRATPGISSSGSPKGLSFWQGLSHGRLQSSGLSVLPYTGSFFQPPSHIHHGTPTHPPRPA